MSPRQFRFAMLLIGLVVFAAWTCLGVALFWMFGSTASNLTDPGIVALVGGGLVFEAIGILLLGMWVDWLLQETKS